MNTFGTRDEAAAAKGTSHAVVTQSGAVVDNENVFIEDALAKYKENERELKRERKYWQMERERELRYKKRLDDWLARENSKMKSKTREAER
jgi:hypothetical protein